MRILPLLLLFASILSCKKKESVSQPYEVECITTNHYFSLEDYSNSDVDTVIIRTFPNDSSFFNPIATQQCHAQKSSLEGSIYNTYRECLINPEYNYEIILPATNDTIRVWRIAVVEKTQTVYPRGSKYIVRDCPDGMTAYATFNGQPVAVENRGISAGAYDMFIEIKH